MKFQFHSPLSYAINDRYGKDLTADAGCIELKANAKAE